MHQLRAKASEQQTEASIAAPNEVCVLNLSTIIRVACGASRQVSCDALLNC